MPTAVIIIFTHCLGLHTDPLYSHLYYHHLSRFLFEDLHAHTQTLLHSHTRTSSDVPFTLTHKVLYNGIKWNNQHFSFCFHPQKLKNKFCPPTQLNWTTMPTSHTLHRHTHTCTFRHMRTQTHTHTHINTPPSHVKWRNQLYAHSNYQRINSLTLTLTRTRTRTCTCTWMGTHTHTPSLTFTHSHSNTKQNAGS